jgi:hypothetical protein
MMFLVEHLHVSSKDFRCNSFATKHSNAWKIFQEFGSHSRTRMPAHNLAFVVCHRIQDQNSNVAICFKNRIPMSHSRGASGIFVQAHKLATKSKFVMLVCNLTSDFGTLIGAPVRAHKSCSVIPVLNCRLRWHCSKSMWKVHCA